MTQPEGAGCCQTPGEHQGYHEGLLLCARLVFDSLAAAWRGGSGASDQCAFPSWHKSLLRESAASTQCSNTAVRVTLLVTGDLAVKCISIIMGHYCS